MADFSDNVDIKDFYESDKRQQEYLKQWENERIIRKCNCGKAYSFGDGDIDPGECASCRGQEGELIF